MPPAGDVRMIEQLRKYRARRGRDVSIGGVIAGVQASTTRTERKLGDLIDAWESLVPETIASRSAITSLRGGTAHVAVTSAATRFELDRLLREGLERELRAAYRGTLMGVRLRVAPGEVNRPTEARTSRRGRARR